MSESHEDASVIEWNIVQRLRKRLADARRAGFRIRTEWLCGETTGWCEFGGSRWIFVDLSLSLAEQLAQLEEALQSFEAQTTQRAAA